MTLMLTGPLDPPSMCGVEASVAGLANFSASSASHRAVLSGAVETQVLTAAALIVIRTEPSRLLVPVAVAPTPHQLISPTALALTEYSCVKLGMVIASWMFNYIIRCFLSPNKKKTSKVLYCIFSPPALSNHALNNQISNFTLHGLSGVSWRSNPHLLTEFLVAEVILNFDILSQTPNQHWS